MLRNPRFARCVDGLLAVSLVACTMASLTLTVGCSAAHAQRYDVVVYGGTAGGTIAAIAAAEEGAKVALLEPRRNLGGMVSGGLGRTDMGYSIVIGGMSLEFFERTGRHYDKRRGWYFEPHVAEGIFNDWVQAAGVEVFFKHRVDTVDVRDGRITSIRMLNGRRFEADVFIDASYEGDVMARAGVTYTVGREGQDKYGESLAGVRPGSEYHQFDVPVSAYDADGNLLPGVYPGPKGETGQGDHKVQAYNFRICLSNDPENQVPFPKPPGYDTKQYEILRRYLALAGDNLKLNDIMIVSPMPNGKTDINNRGPFSTNLIGASWAYPDADYAEREAIWDAQLRHVQGFFYFLANDPSVPKHLQDAFNEYALAKDEFVETDHWPHQMYIREARRMVGPFVMTQKDLQNERTKPDSIGMGSYNSDSHHVQRVVKEDGTLENEGDMQVPVQPYEIPYRILTPQRDECENLLVISCFSASHVAYSSLRMEPQYMIVGHAAGLASSWSVRNDANVQDVDIDWLQQRLREQRAILSWKDTPMPGIAASTLPGIIVDAVDAVVEGTWRVSAAFHPFVNWYYLHDHNRYKGENTARYTPDLPAAGLYEVRVSHSSNHRWATNVPVTIRAADSQVRMTLNLQAEAGDPPFTSLGVFRFEAGRSGYVEFSNADTDGYVVLDAVQWLPQSQP
jgi:hypothetical protein